MTSNYVSAAAQAAEKREVLKNDFCDCLSRIKSLGQAQTDESQREACRRLYRKVLQMARDCGFGPERVP